MDRKEIIASLKAERDHLDAAIEILQGQPVSINMVLVPKDIPHGELEGGTSPEGRPDRKKRKISKASRKRMSIAQKKRWEVAQKK